MARFIQLGNSYSAQEANWIRGAKNIYMPKGWLDTTQALTISSKQRAETTEDFYIPLKEIDFHDFDALLKQLRPLQLQIYKLSRLHYYVDEHGRRRYMYRRKWMALKIPEYQFNRQLDWAIDNLKKWGNLE